MASQQELANSALQHALKTSWTWDKFLARIRNDPTYQYENTEWYEAGEDLEEAKHASSGGGNPTPPDPPVVAGDLSDAQARIFLAQSPLDALAAPTWMVPVVTADHGYRYWYDSATIGQLRARFGRVEAWCDCRIPSGYVEGQGTGYDEAVKMTQEFGLDGPAWGQCETNGEFDNGYAGGARRFIGQLADLSEDNRHKIGASKCHMTFELYRNKMPWQVPDYKDVGDGVGGNTIGIYASSSEGAVYTPVSDYKSLGYYVPKRDSVYGVGLTPADWAALA